MIPCALGLWNADYVLKLAANDLTRFLLAFGTLGAAISGYMISAQALVLEFGSAEDIPMRLALSTTTETAVASIGPLIGWLVVASAGFWPIINYSLLAIVAAATLILFKVQEPRFRKST
jgi:hypothetical protein